MVLGYFVIIEQIIHFSEVCLILGKVSNCGWSGSRRSNLGVWQKLRAANTGVFLHIIWPCQTLWLSENFLLIVSFNDNLLLSHVCYTSDFIPPYHWFLFNHLVLAILDFTFFISNLSFIECFIHLVDFTYLFVTECTKHFPKTLSREWKCISSCLIKVIQRSHFSKEHALY